MAEGLSIGKGTVRKNKQDAVSSRSFLNYGNTPSNTVNSGRLSLMSNARLQKITSNSLEKLSFISDREENNDLDDYYLEYSTYLLRKVQNRILAENKKQKEESIKKCFVFLKFEFEGLLETYVNLSKEIGYLKIFLEILRETNEKIENGKKILNALKENEVENFLKSLSTSLDHTINQLQLVDIDKSLIDEAFNKKVWGSGSEIEECLKKVDGFISKNKDEVSKIADELIEIKKLSMENEVLKKRFYSLLEKVSNEFLEKHYQHFTGIVKRAFNLRQESNSHSLDCELTEFLQSSLKPANERLTFQLSNLDCSYPVTPNSASTPNN